jgi:hypothetical protein
LKKVARTFVDSVLNLCSKSLTSCGGNPAMEHPFLLLVKDCGFIEAKCWAEGLHIPHVHSSAMLSRLMLGPRRELASFSNGTFRPALKSASAVPQG